MGSKFWIRKYEEVQAILDEHNPDVLFLMEANIFFEDPECSLSIEDYKMVRPATWKHPDLRYAKIIPLIKQNINFEVLDRYMEEHLSTIWIKISRRGQRKLIVGGIYREHNILRQQDNTSGEPQQQEERWKRIVAQWVKASADSDSVILVVLAKSWSGPQEND